MTLTPEKIESYDPTHLIDTAEWIGQQHPRWDSHFIYQLNDLQGMGNFSVNGEKTIADADSDVGVSQILTAEAVAAQATALDGVTSLMTMQGMAVTALEDARNTGYSVDSQFGVKDALPPNPATSQERQQLATWHANNIAQHVGNFQKTQQAVAEALRTHGQILQGHVQMVDSHAFATDKGVSPGGPPVSPDPSKQGDKKPRSFGDDFDSFTKVVGGVGAIGGGVAAVGIGGASEVGTEGLSSPVSIPTILGGLTAIAGGAGSIEKGLNELFSSGE